MKIRIGFVSNSSSSSFLIDKNKLTPSQKFVLPYILTNHKRIAEKLLGYSLDDCGYYSWDTQENDNFYMVSTFMDNFDLIEFLQKIYLDGCIVSIAENNSDLTDSDGRYVDTSTFEWLHYQELDDDIVRQINKRIQKIYY